MSVSPGRAVRKVGGVVHEPGIHRPFRWPHPIIHMVEPEILDQPMLFPSTRERFNYTAQGGGVASAPQSLFRGSAVAVEAGEAFVDELLQLLPGGVGEATVVFVDVRRVAGPVRLSGRILRGHWRKMPTRRDRLRHPEWGAIPQPGRHMVIWIVHGLGEGFEDAEPEGDEG